MGTVSDAVANAWLDALCRGVPYDNDEFWAQLHLGDPGAAGTSNPAAETTRKQATFSAASGRAITTSAALEWTNVSTTEVYSHISFWSASTAGTFLGRDDLSSTASVEAGDTFRVPAGDLDLAIS